VKLLVLALLALAASSAQAQKVFRCVDERGRSTYTEKPGKNCKPVRVDPAPGTAAPSPSAAGKPPPPSAAGQAPPASAAGGQRSVPFRPVKQSAATKLTRQVHCDGLVAEAQQLDGATSASAARRLAGITKELNRSCR
jgi:hypothetical protein